jgi:hypothetical protein
MACGRLGLQQLQVLLLQAGAACCQLRLLMQPRLLLLLLWIRLKSQSGHRAQIGE